MRTWNDTRALLVATSICIGLGSFYFYACGGGDDSSATTGQDGGGNGDGSVTGDGGSGGDGSSGGDGGTSACLGGNCIDTLTEHGDNARTGLYSSETKLTPTNVTQATFGLLFELPVDGKVDAQPLYVQNVAVAGKGTHNVIFVETEHDSIYAFDAETKPDAGTSLLWGPVSMLGASETPSDAVFGCGQVTPEIGVTSTPVIDLATNTMFLIAMSKNGTTYHQRIHAIDITSGTEKAGSPKEVTATYAGTSTNEGDGSNLTFAPKQHKERSALLLDRGTIYTTWSSHCDHGPYSGWIIAYDESLNQTTVWNDEPNNNGGGAAFWNAGAGPALDSASNLYHATGNGGFDSTMSGTGFPMGNDYGNSFLKLTPSTSTLTVADYFTEGNETAESSADVDMGSSGVMVLPDSVGSAAHPHLLVGSGKDGHIYLMDTANMGKFNADGGNGQIVQDIPNATGTQFDSGHGSFGAPAYFNGAIYYCGVGQSLKKWNIANGQIATPQASETSTNFQYPGATPTISWNGADASTAIVWAHENSNPVLHAYSAADVSNEYYNSEQAANHRDRPTGGANKFIIPLVANGRVYMGTQSSVAVYGLLP